MLHRPFRRLFVACALTATTLGGFPLLTTSAAWSQVQPPLTAEQVLEKAIEAYGGREKLEAVKTLRMESTLTFVGQGIELKGVSTMGGEAGFLTVMSNPQLGEIRIGSDGQTTWEISPLTGSRIIDGPEAEAVRRSSALDTELRFRDYFKDIRMIGIEPLDGVRHFVIELTDKADNVETRFYHAENFLLTRTTGTLQSQMGEIPVQTTVLQYKEVDGIKVPAKVQVVQAGMTLMLTVDKVEFNPTINPDLFKLPDEIRKLIDR